MRIPSASFGLMLVVVTLLPWPCRAQAAATLGTRAQGMAGAFVGVADDASAVYWNPAGLAGGAYFSLVLDGTSSEATPDGDTRAGSRSGWLLALSMPALGLSYYRLGTESVAPSGSDPDGFRLDSLVTHHVGATLVQSLTSRLAVGATIKMVRGFAGTAEIRAPEASDALDDWDLMGQHHSRVDVDLGIMATGSMGRIGLVARNLSEPAFDTGQGRELSLERQVRAGGAVILLPKWALAADVDLLRHRAAFGDVREVALGTEAQVTRRFAARGGVRLNTTGDRGRTPAVSVGGSFAVLGGLLVDAQVTAGSDEAFTGWGVAGRVVF